MKRIRVKVLKENLRNKLKGNKVELDLLKSQKKSKRIKIKKKKK
jgi:hypothetical protein